MAEHICTAEKLKYKRGDGSLGALRALTPGSERRGSCALETSSRMFIGTIRELKSGIPRARRIRDYGGRDERCASETPREDSPGKGEQIKLEITYIRLNYHSPTFPLSLFRSFSCTALTAQHHISPLALFFPTLHVVCTHHLSGKNKRIFTRDRLGLIPLSHSRRAPPTICFCVGNVVIRRIIVYSNAAHQ